MLRQLSRLAAVWVALLGLAAAAAGAPPDWNAVADIREIEALTANDDSSPRETTIWLIVVEGQGYIRTGGTRWGNNAERDPDIALRIEGTEYPVRVAFVEDDEEREAISAAFREKYGWIDGMLNVFRGSRPRIMRVDPRD
jgi:hypothetical protein